METDTAGSTQVDELHVGRIELPPSLLHTQTLMSPYLQPWCIGTVGTGAGAVRSRNDLPRGAHRVAA